MEIKSNKKKLLEVASILVIGIIFGVTYSWLVVSKSSNTLNKIKAGNLELELDDTTSSGIKLVNAVPMSYQQGINTTEYNFSLENTGTIKAAYKLSLDDVATFINDNNEEVTITSADKIADSNIRYILVKGNDPKVASNSKLLSTATNRVIDEGEINAGVKIEYTLQIWIDSRAGENNTQADVMGKYFNAKLNVLGEQIRPSNYVKAYTYNQTAGASNYCVTGEEETCAETECYKTKTANSCPAGTIIKYKVNNETTETFHVMYDSANKVTMQSQKNTIYNTAWDFSQSNTNGPLALLPVLENATRDWVNVEDQTYEMGTTNFPIGDEGQFPNANSGTSCNNTSCSENKYTLAPRTAKARMITVQETAMLGCTNANQSCPIWMNNYLYQSTNYGGTINDNELKNGEYNYGYWTMSVDSSTIYYVIEVSRRGEVSYYGASRTSNSGHGARAVVVVNK